MVEPKALREVMLSFPLGKNIPNHSSKDEGAYWAIKNAYGRKFFFCDSKQDDSIKPFDTVLERALNVQPVRDQDENIVLLGDINFRGPSKLKTTISILKEGEIGKPIIAHIPGYGSNPNRILPYLGGMKETRGCTVLGVELFHDKIDRVKAGSSFDNLQVFFASGVAAEDLVVRLAMSSGSPLYIIGGSFGAKVINIAMNAQEKHGLVLADRYMAIEGGRLDNTFSNANSYYAGRMANKGFLSHPALREGYGFPHQGEPLPKKGAERTTAVINPYDRVAVEQEGIWGGADKTVVIGGGPFFARAHGLAPLWSIFKVKEAIAQNLNNLSIKH